jgi:hypothetical protein
VPVANEERLRNGRRDRAARAPEVEDVAATIRLAKDGVRVASEPPEGLAGGRPAVAELGTHVDLLQLLLRSAGRGAADARRRGGAMLDDLGHSSRRNGAQVQVVKDKLSVVVRSESLTSLAHQSVECVAH